MLFSLVDLPPCHVVEKSFKSDLGQFTVLFHSCLLPEVQESIIDQTALAPCKASGTTANISCVYFKTVTSLRVTTGGLLTTQLTDSGGDKSEVFTCLFIFMLTLII